MGILLADTHENAPIGSAAEIIAGAIRPSAKATKGPIMKPITVTVAQATQITNLSRTTIYALMREGTLSKKKIGSRTLLQYDEVQNLVSPKVIDKTLTTEGHHYG